MEPLKALRVLMKQSQKIRADSAEFGHGSRLETQYTLFKTKFINCGVFCYANTPVKVFFDVPRCEMK